MLPSLFTSDGNARPWSVPRAALYGAGIGLAAALIKIFGPFHAADCASRRSGKSVLWFSPLGCFAPALHCCAICWRDGSRTRDTESRDQADQAAPLLSGPHGRMGPARGAGPSKTRFLLVVALHKIKFHPGTWDATGRDNALN